MQVLWCPIDHGWIWCPSVVVRWRRAADVRQPLLNPPTPVGVTSRDYVPRPCTLTPEQAVEYASAPLPPELDEALTAWREENDEDLDTIAPGWKIGGFASWGLTDHYEMLCECGSELRLIMGAGGYERAEHRGLWRAGRP